MQHSIYDTKLIVIDKLMFQRKCGEGEQECWFGEGGCHESSEIESGSWRDCVRVG